VTVLELISEGLELMVIGMTVVFVFLGALVFLVTNMSRLAQKFGPATVPAQSATGSAGTSDDLIAVISAAVHQYRNTKRK
jgi:oxaloacetate decarboxylase gamma subunit